MIRSPQRHLAAIFAAGDLLAIYSLPTHCRLGRLAAARLVNLAAAIDFSVYPKGWAISPIEFLGVLL